MVSGPFFRNLGLRSRALPLIRMSGVRSWVPGPTYSTGSRVILFRNNARNNSYTRICKFGCFWLLFTQAIMVQILKQVDSSNGQMVVFLCFSRQILRRNVIWFLCEHTKMPRFDFKVNRKNICSTTIISGIFEIIHS